MNRPLSPLPRLMALWASLSAISFAAPAAPTDWNAKMEEWCSLAFGSAKLTYVIVKGKRPVSEAEPIHEWQPVTLQGAARQLATGIHLVEVIKQPPPPILIGYRERVLAVREATPTAWGLAQVWGASLVLLNEPLRPVSPTQDAEASLKIDPDLPQPAEPARVRGAADLLTKACLWHHLGARQQAALYASRLLGNHLNLVEPALLHQLADQRYLILLGHWASDGDHQKFLAGLDGLLSAFPHSKIWQNRGEAESVRETVRQTLANPEPIISGRFHGWWTRLHAAGPPMTFRIHERSSDFYEIWWRLADEWRAGMMGVKALPLARHLSLTPEPHIHDAAALVTPAMNSWREGMREWLLWREDALLALLEMLESNLAMPYIDGDPSSTYVASYVVPGEDWRQLWPEPSVPDTQPADLAEQQWRLQHFPRPLTSRMLATRLLLSMLPDSDQWIEKADHWHEPQTVAEIKEWAEKWHHELRNATPWQAAWIFYTSLDKRYRNALRDRDRLAVSALLKAPDAASHQKLRDFLTQHLQDDYLAGHYMASLKDKISDFLPEYRAAAERWLKAQPITSPSVSFVPSVSSDFFMIPAASVDAWRLEDLTDRLRLYSILEKPSQFKTQFQELFKAGKEGRHKALDLAFELTSLIPPEEPAKALLYLSPLLRMTEGASQDRQEVLLDLFFQCVTGRNTYREAANWDRFHNILPLLIEQNRPQLLALLKEDFLLFDRTPANLRVAVILEGLDDAEAWDAWYDTSPLTDAEKQTLLLTRARARVNGTPVPPLPTP